VEEEEEEEKKKKREMAQILSGLPDHHSPQRRVHIASTEPPEEAQAEKKPRSLLSSNLRSVPSFTSFHTKPLGLILNAQTPQSIDLRSDHWPSGVLEKEICLFCPLWGEGGGHEATFFLLKECWTICNQLWTL